MIYNQISPCCRRGIFQSIRFPDNSGTNLPLKVKLCSCCGGKVDKPIAVTKCCGEEKCICKLESKRAEMVSEANRLGVNDPTVIALSQQVDELHNEINRGART